MKLISFLITSYNLDDWMLKRCIDSLFTQGLGRTEFEIIVVDDGSDRSPRDIIDAYQNPNLRFHRQPNGGPGAARNTAMSLAQGKYLLFVDGDDYLLPHALLPLLDALKTKEPDILRFAYQTCRTEQITEPTRDSDRKLPEFRSYASGAAYMISENLVGCNWLYLFKRALVSDRNLRYPERIVHEDEDFITKLVFFAGLVLCTDHCVYAYYIRPDSIVHQTTVKQTEKRLADFLHVVRSLSKFRQMQQPTDTELQQLALQKKIDLLGVDFLIKLFRTDSAENYLRKYAPQLGELKLFPLPARDYSIKYTLFRILSNYRCGRKLLQTADSWRPKKF